VNEILDLVRGHPDVAHEETDSASSLPAALARLARRDLDLLVINGGDGTLQHALTEILARRAFDRLPVVALLPGGRTNMAALDLGCDRDPVRGLEALLADTRAGRLGSRFVDRPVLRVERDRGRRVECGTFFGVGMIQRAITTTHRIFPPGRSQGGLGAGLMTLALVTKAIAHPRDGILQPDKLQIRVDGETLAGGEYYLAIATTLQRLFWRFDPFWGPGSGPVRFTCVRSDAKRIWAAAPGILRGRPGRIARPANGYTSRRAERVQMLFDSGFTIDGEIFECRPDEYVTLAGDRRLTFARA
jgi:diacylglycerol kinase family enzyme